MPGKEQHEMGKSNTSHGGLIEPGMRRTLLRSSWLRFVGKSAVCFLILSAVGLADSGTIGGRVTDPQGSSVAGARIQLLNAAGLKVGETVRGAGGMFLLAN